MSAEHPDQPEVAVVVVTHDSADVLPACLDALPAALRGVDRWQVIVVDNASADATPALVRERAPEVELLELGRNAGYAAAINAGVEACLDARNVLVLNPDIRLAPGSVVALLDAASRPGVGIAVPKLLDEDGRLQPSLRREPSVGRALAEAVVGGTRASRLGAWGEVVGDADRYEFEQPVDWASGAAMLVSAACLAEVGRWDESFFLYSEETDFALRSRDAGYLTWYTPAAEAVHLGGESNTSPELWSLLTVNRTRLFRKRHGTISSALFRAAVIVNEALRALTGSATHRAGLEALIGRRPVPGPEPAGHAGGESHAGGRPEESGPGWICFSSVDWWYFNRAHADFQLMRRVAARRPVLLVNSIGMRMPMPGRSTEVSRRIARKLKSVAHLMRQPLPDTPGFHVVTPLMLPLYGSPMARRVNARLVGAQVRLLARRIGIDPGRAVVMVSIPTAWEVVRSQPRQALLYNRSDKHSAFEESDQQLIGDLERQLIRGSDAVLYVSHSLMDEEQADARDRAVFLDHGVDLDHFGGDPGPEPADLAAIPHPRVGFFGGIDDYTVDLDLLEHVARSMPDVSLVLIGDATQPMDRFEVLPNVHWLGFKPYETIPAYGAGFDVALMPWLRNQWIEHSNPIKLKEYLALGLPVVSMDFPEVRHYADVVAIAHDRDEFVHLIGEALEGRPVATPESRRARVAEATWERQADYLLAVGEGRVG